MTDFRMRSAATSFARSVQQAMHKRHTYIEFIQEQAVRHGVVQGTVELLGAGELVVDVAFPVTFLERPVFTVGLELADNQWLVAGQFPLWSATLASWDTNDQGNSTNYTGAHLGVVLFGPETIVSNLHFSFAAKAFAAPIGAGPSLGEAM